MQRERASHCNTTTGKQTHSQHHAPQSHACFLPLHAYSRTHLLCANSTLRARETTLHHQSQPLPSPLNSPLFAALAPLSHPSPDDVPRVGTETGSDTAHTIGHSRQHTESLSSHTPCARIDTAHSHTHPAEQSTPQCRVVTADGRTENPLIAPLRGAPNNPNNPHRRHRRCRSALTLPCRRLLPLLPAHCRPQPQRPHHT